MRVPMAVVVVALCSASPTGAETPSFDCRTAISARERVVCRDAEAARADHDMGEAYATARRRLPRALSELLRLDQKAFLEGLDDGFNAEMWFKRDEPDDRGATGDLRRVVQTGGSQLQRLIGEMRSRTIFLSGIIIHRPGFDGIWRNSEASLVVSPGPDGGRNVVYASPSYGWPKYACGFRVSAVPVADDLVGERPFNTDIAEVRDTRLVFSRDGALLRIDVNPGGEERQRPCRHARDWERPFFAVALGGVR